MIDPLLKIQEVAAALQVSPPTIYRLIDKGLLPRPLKLGRTSRWSKAEIVAAIKAAKDQGRAS